MSKTHIVIPDPHAHPDFNNDRADWLGNLINDIKPDVVVNIGDMFDMPSMAEYDKGKKSFWGRTYRKDLDAGLDFDERIWAPIRKAKKKRPFSVFMEGNHEYRLKRALSLQPELEGTVSFDDFELNKNYHEVIEYEGQTPGIYEIDGIHYAHYFTSGVMGRPIGGEKPAYTLLTKQFCSVTCGHTHTFDLCVRQKTDGTEIIGAVAGVYQDYDSPWAGEVNKLWKRGVLIKRGVESGSYDPEWISIERMRKEYGT